MTMTAFNVSSLWFLPLPFANLIPSKGSPFNFQFPTRSSRCSGTPPTDVMSVKDRPTEPGKGPEETAILCVSDSVGPKFIDQRDRNVTNGFLGYEVEEWHNSGSIRAGEQVRKKRVDQLLCKNAEVHLIFHLFLEITLNWHLCLWRKSIDTLKQRVIKTLFKWSRREHSNVKSTCEFLQPSARERGWPTNWY